MVGVLLFVSYFGRQYGSLCFALAGYYLYPFGKFILIERGETTPLIPGEEGGEDPSAPSYHSVNELPTSKKKKRDCGIGCVIWSMLACK